MVEKHKWGYDSLAEPLSGLGDPPRTCTLEKEQHEVGGGRRTGRGRGSVAENAGAAPKERGDGTLALAPTGHSPLFLLDPHLCPGFRNLTSPEKCF